MLSRCFLDCSVGVGVFVTGLSRISSFFSYTQRKTEFFIKQCPPPPPDTGIPLKHDYIFIKEVDTPNGISYHGGDDVVHAFWYLGKVGGMKVTRYQNVILLTYLRSVLRYPMYNRVFLHSALIISIVKYSKFYAW